jgi:hypothetical protein
MTKVGTKIPFQILQFVDTSATQPTKGLQMLNQVLNDKKATPLDSYLFPLMQNDGKHILIDPDLLL